ncbi:MAG: PAS domain S-box protein, partial [Planctomycetota bacterium]
HRRNRPCEPYPCPTLKAFQDGKVHQYESQVTDKTGRTRHFHTVANVALRDTDEKPTAVLEICREITERKRTEEALRLSERKYSDLVQQSPDAIISLDKTGNFLSFNPAAERLSGFSTKDVLGRHFAKIGIIAKESRPNAIKELGLILMGTDRPPFELTIMRGDKTRLFMEANARLIKQKGRNTWIQVTLRDITERKQAEDRLEKINTCLLSLGSDFIENANRITALLGELLGASCTMYNCIQNGMLCSTSYWNASSDYTPQDKPNGHICYDVIQGGDTEVCVIRDLQSSPYARSDPNVLTYGLKTYVGQLVKSNGNHHGTLCALFTKDFDPSADEKKIIGILASALRGEEERRMAEQKLERLNVDLESANLELTRANKELQEFAYITAHDLKTPLRAMGTLADWISTDYADTFDEEGRKQVRLLVEKAEQMSALIDDILQYSRLGQEYQQKRQVDLNQVISDMIAGIAPSENIEISIRNELPVLVCDKTQIVQVFQNLVSNAIKYMNKPEARIEIGCVEEDGFWKFSVSDNGPGIDEKYFGKIFKIFQTLAPRHGTESTGIGLSIVKKLVELNKGKVWVESIVGRGSTFFFTLPKSPVLQEAAAEAASASERC